MSRAITPTQAQPGQPQQGQTRVPQEKIAQRAYEKWLQRGQQFGNPDQDWLAAEQELTQEFNRTQGKPTQQQTRR